MKTNLLFEITTYDIPYYLQKDIQSQLERSMASALDGLKVNYDLIVSFSTSRRIALYVAHIDKATPALEVVKKGPRVGCTPGVLAKFKATNHLTEDELLMQETPKGSFYFAQKHMPSAPLGAILPDLLTNKILPNINLKRPMFWNETKVKWARPIVNLLLMLGEEKISFSYAGVNSNGYLLGHMFLTDNQPCQLKRAEEYFSELLRAKVLLLASPADEERYGQLRQLASDYSLPMQLSRAAVIEKGVHDFAHEKGLTINLPPKLAEELVYLSEQPKVLMGTIPPKYLQLPPEVLIDTMVKNQRYINFFTPSGTVAEHFAMVANINPKDESEILKGNQKVLVARLEDAWFFFQQDRSADWNQQREELKKLIFFEGLGSMWDKQERMAHLAQAIFSQPSDEQPQLRANQVKSDPNDAAFSYSELKQAISFCKVDLTTKVVLEFPDLQGTMGYYYAQLAGYSQGVALAIKEHYLPEGPNSEVPNSPLGALLALLDKLDTIISFFSIGCLPSSSGDPFGLRRAALGIVRIILQHSLNFNLATYVEPNVLKFIQERLLGYLTKEMGLSKNVVRAVAAVEHMGNIFTFTSKAAALNKFISANLAITHLYKRVANILGSLPSWVKLETEEEDIPCLLKRFSRVFSPKFAASAAKIGQIIEQIQMVKKEGIPGQALGFTIGIKPYEQHLALLASMPPILTDLFEDTLIINESDKVGTSGRVAVLHKVAKLLDETADFKQLIS